MYVIQYVRVSSEGQLDGTGYERQAESIDGYCRVRQWEPQFVAMDQVSGADTDISNRIGLMAAWAQLELIPDPEKIIVVEDSKRWARDVMVGEYLLGQCRSKGIKVWSALENMDLTVDASNPTAKMMQQLFSVLAQWDKAITVQRLKAGRMINRRTGKGRGGIEGNRPYGFLPGEERQLILMFSLRSSGHTYDHIADELHIKGFKTRSGKRWTRRAVHKIVKNPRSAALVPEFTTI